MLWRYRILFAALLTLFDQHVDINIFCSSKTLTLLHWYRLVYICMHLLILWIMLAFSKQSEN